MLLNPSFQFFEIDRRQCRQVGAKFDGVANVNVFNFVLILICIPMQHDTNAFLQRTFDLNFVSTQ